MRTDTNKISQLLKFSKKLDRTNEVPEIEKIAGMFPRGYYSIVASMAGTGKTWLMQYITCALSIGGEILGGLSEEKSKKSLIFSGETGSELLTLRLQKSAWKNDPDKIRIYSALEMATAGINCWINTPEGQDTIFNIVAIEQPDIIFFDTLISFHTADESKQGEMTTLYVWLARLARAFKCAIVCNHHTRKRPAQDSKRKFTQEDVIGSSAGVRLAANVFVISSEEKPSGGFINTVDNVKSWDRKTPPFTYEFLNTANGIDFAINLNVRPQMSVPTRFIDWLRTLDAGAMFCVSDVEKQCKCTRYMAQEQIDKLYEYGSIDKVEMNLRGKHEIFYQLVRMLPKVWP